MKKTVVACVLFSVLLFGCNALDVDVFLGEHTLLAKHQLYGSGKYVFVFDDGLVITDSVKRLSPALEVGKRYKIFRDNMRPFYYRAEVVN